MTQFVLKNEHLNFDTKSFRDEPYFMAKRRNIHWITHYRKNFFIIIWACIILGVKKLWHLLALLGCEGLRFTATYVFHFSRKMQNCIYITPKRFVLPHHFTYNISKCCSHVSKSRQIPIVKFSSLEIYVLLNFKITNDVTYSKWLSIFYLSGKTLKSFCIASYDGTMRKWKPE